MIVRTMRQATTIQAMAAGPIRWSYAGRVRRLHACDMKVAADFWPHRRQEKTKGEEENGRDDFSTAAAARG